MFSVNMILRKKDGLSCGNYEDRVSEFALGLCRSLARVMKITLGRM